MYGGMITAHTMMFLADIIEWAVTISIYFQCRMDKPATGDWKVGSVLIAFLT